MLFPEKKYFHCLYYYYYYYYFGMLAKLDHWKEQSKKKHEKERGMMDSVRTEKHGLTEKEPSGF